MDDEKILSKGYLLIDTKKCSGCMSCMMACSLAHEGKVNLSHSCIQIKKNVFGSYPKDDIEQYVCKQCADAPCVAACPFGALVIDKETGVRTIIREKCKGCRKCVKACKYQPSRIAFDSEARVAIKCDLCANTPFWDEKGGVNGKQACIGVCALQAIKFTDTLPESEEDYEVNLRKSLHYARATFPVDDAGLQPAKEALTQSGWKLMGPPGVGEDEENVEIKK